MELRLNVETTNRINCKNNYENKESLIEREIRERELYQNCISCLNDEYNELSIFTE